MKYGLIATAVITSVAATPAALAKDLDLFGILYIEAGSVEEGNNAESRNYFGDENGMGRFGFKGSHKINDDLSLVGYAAWNLNVGDANDEKAGNKSITITDRDHNVGFKGNFGEIVFGSFDGAYKETGGAKYDAFASTALQARGNGGMATGPFGTTSYFHNALRYLTPNYNGLRANIQYSIDERARGGALKSYNGAYNIGLTYDFLKNYQIIAATNSVKTTTAGNKGNSKLGFKAKFGDLTAMFQIEDVEVMGTAVRDLDIWFAALQYKIGKTLLVGQYGNLSDNANSVNDQTYYALGGRYSFDKQTSTYFGVKNTGFDSPTKDDLMTYMVALRFDF